MSLDSRAFYGAVLTRKPLFSFGGLKTRPISPSGNRAIEEVLSHERPEVVVAGAHVSVLSYVSFQAQGILQRHHQQGHLLPE